MGLMPKPIRAVLAAIMLVVGLCASAVSTPAAGSSGEPGVRTGGLADTGRSTLILYDTGGHWGWLGEGDAIQVANLTGHFGSFTAAPVKDYQAGDMKGYTAVMYVGSTYDERLPRAFLTDVRSTERPVVWLDGNISQ